MTNSPVQLKEPSKSPAIITKPLRSVQFLFQLGQVKPRLVNANNLQKVKAHATAAHASATAAAATVAARLHGHISSSAATSRSQTPTQQQQSCTAATFTSSDLHDQCLASFNETVDRLRNTPQLAKLVQATGVDKLLQSLQQSTNPLPARNAPTPSLRKPNSKWKIDYTSSDTFRVNRGECGGRLCTLQMQPTSLLGTLVGTCSTFG